jgi:hypothetical protein
MDSTDRIVGHLNWHRVSTAVKAEIQLIGKRVGDRLWDFDSKLAALLDSHRERQHD